MFNFPDFIIILVALVIAIPISRLLVNQLGKFVAPTTKPYLFLVIATIPFYEIIKLSITNAHFFRFSFFYFWLIFFISSVLLFFIELKKR